MSVTNYESLTRPLELPCGLILKNRIVKSAMSDSLGDGQGNPTEPQIRLYQRWAEGGVAAMIVGEVQFSPHFAEKPGNLVLRSDSNHARFKELAIKGADNGSLLWLQLGHAGALAHPPISTPKGPSKIKVPGLSCEALTLEEIRSLPDEFATAAQLAQRLGFSGVQIHAAHGFLLSQFLSPLFNTRTDEYGGSIDNRMRLLLEVIDKVQKADDGRFAITVKLNSSDQLQGGLDEKDSLAVVSALHKTSIDLIDISGGTYFPGAKSASDSTTSGPYFLEYAKNARKLTEKPIMVTGGFKTLDQAATATASGNADIVGLARALVIDPELPNHWLSDRTANPAFPEFYSPPEGGITAWYTMRIAAIGNDQETDNVSDLDASLTAYNDRDMNRVSAWKNRFKIIR